MERKEIGRFYATAFDETVYTFIVYEDGIACPLLNAERIKIMELKPRFTLMDYNYNDYFMPVKAGYKEGLIKSYDIDSELFSYLKQRHMIMYSTDMAYLYGFEDRKGFDNQFKRTPFKRSKGKILTKQKQGIFN